MAGNEQRLTVKAYAAGQSSNASQARRLSLSRALAVRSYLIDKGIRSTRIDVQAMGAPDNANGPADRVDLTLASQ
jgi:outer membrane protein OmpA-like peptidoglycan-associated protein